MSKRAVTLALEVLLGAGLLLSGGASAQIIQTLPEIRVTASADGAGAGEGDLYETVLAPEDLERFGVETLEDLTETQRQILDNRRLLYSVMHEAGFTNLPSEWWHYDAGDQLWAHYGKHERAVYGPAELETVESRWRRQL